MTERIILSALAVWMFSLTMNQQGLWNKIIVGGLTVGMVILLIRMLPVMIIGCWIIVLFSLLIVVYAIVRRNLSAIERAVIALLGFSVFIKDIFNLQHWPYANEVKLMMFFPIVGYCVYLLRNKFKVKPEFGFLTILVVDCGFHFWRIVGFWMGLKSDI